jgi:uncharacterized protein with PQ loop repeat
MEVLSYIFSVCSIVFYSIVYFPQFNEIYKTKLTDGISIYTLLLYTQADFLSLFGTIILALTSNIILLGWYHVLVGICMILFVLNYEKENRKMKFLYALIFCLVNISIGISLSVFSIFNEVIGETIGWITMVIYIVGRFPQIFLNIKRKSTEGLSSLMYVFTILGNLFYALSVLVYLDDTTYIMYNLPWLISTFVTILLDIFVIFQCKIIYANKIEENSSKIDQYNLI